MTAQITTNELIHSVVTLLTEAYAGPPDPSSTWFIDNEPDSGILGLIRTVSAEEASTSVDNTGNSGTTIAANIEHLRWSLANANAALRGKDYDNHWSESWKLIHADKTIWDQLRQELSKEYEALCQGLKMQKDLPEQYMLGVVALVAHAAYHLGTIRQMIERVRSR